jgi:predicted amidophosphoribosyltransferase
MHHLAAEISKITKIPLDRNALLLCKKSNSQMGLALQERMVNRKNAFVASPANLVDKRVLVIDDVMTSGQTLKSAIEALRNSEAAEVDALILARTPL